mmetsp:Transcript_90541/g.230326  ORF Transcript_90541/g.230326 Transcript_90541/m.230326 type:complete len:355 (+) Transcript_90541:39-1103(+)
MATCSLQTNSMQRGQKASAHVRRRHLGKIPGVELVVFEVTHRCRQLRIRGRVGVLFGKEALGVAETDRTGGVVVLVVPKRHVHTSVGVVVILPTALACERLEVVDALQCVYRNITGTRIAIRAVPLAGGVKASTSRLARIASLVVQVVPLGAALPGQAVPCGIRVVHLRRPLERRELVRMVAADEIAVLVPLLSALEGPCALATVEGVAHAHGHAQLNHRLGGLRADEEPLNASLLKASLEAVVHDLVVQVPHGACQVGHVLILGIVVLIVLDAVHVIGEFRGIAGVQEALGRWLVACWRRCRCYYRCRCRCRCRRRCRWRIEDLASPGAQTSRPIEVDALPAITPALSIVVVL